MSLSSANNRNDYTGNGAVDTYNYTFRIFDEDDLLVTVKNTLDVETTLVKTTDYTVTGVGAAAGGTIVLVNSAQAWLDGDGDLLTNYILTIKRVIPLVQETDIRNQGAFYPEIHEDQFDKLVMIDQQQQDEIDRAVKLPITILSSAFDPTLPTDIGDNAGATILVNSTGDGFEMGTSATSISVHNADTTAVHGIADTSILLTTTGSQTVSNKTIDNSNTIVAKDSTFTIQDNSDATKQAQFQASGITTGTTRTYVLPDASTTLVGDNTTQTLSGKTLGSSTVLTILDANLTIQDNVDATKQAQFQASGITTGTTRTYTLPDATTTLIGDNTSQTLTGKTISGANNTLSNLNLAALSTKTTTYTALTTDDVLLLDTSGGAWTLTLPSGAGLRKPLYLKKFTADLNPITFSGTVDGVASRQMWTLNESMILVPDGTNWQVLAHNSAMLPISYTPTFAGLGTVTNISFTWQRIGAAVSIKGTFTTGTVTGSTMNFSLPTGLTVSSLLPAGTNTKVGTWVSVGVTAYLPALVQTTNTTVQAGANNAAGGLGSQAGNVAYTNTSNGSVEVLVPIEGWF